MDNTGNLHFSPIVCPGDEAILSSSPETQEKITFFPNPSNGIVTIDMGNSPLRKQSYSLINMNGQSALSGRIYNSIQEIDVSSLTSGVYLLAINDKKGNRIATDQLVIE